jgi:hypothetical protein
MASCYDPVRNAEVDAKVAHMTTALAGSLLDRFSNR